MKVKNIFCYLGLWIFLTTCQSTNSYQDIRNYYFPLKALQDGQVYEYQPQGNTPTGPAYWYYRSIIQEGSVHLTATYYEQDLLPLQFSNELMTSSGMVLEDLFLYETDSLSGDQTQTTVQVEVDDVFPFRVRKEGGVYLYHVRWDDPNEQGTFSLIKNRRYLRDTTFVFEKQSYPAQLFELRELISHDQEGVWEQEYQGQEIYAKGLGLVYYSKKVTEALELSYRLAKRYPMTVLEEKFRLQYPQEDTLSKEHRASATKNDSISDR